MQFLPLSVFLICCCCLVDSLASEEQTELEWALSQLPHHRSKRFLFLTEEKRLVMPPGTQLVLTPTLALPFLR